MGNYALLMFHYSVSAVRSGQHQTVPILWSSGVPRNFFRRGDYTRNYFRWVYTRIFSGVYTRNLFGGGGVYTRHFFRGGGSTNSVEDRGQRERESGGGRPLVGGFTQFANELNPYCNYVFTYVDSTELGIWLSFVKISEFREGGFQPPPPSVRHCCGQISGLLLFVVELVIARGKVGMALTLGRPKWVIRDPMSQHFNKFMRLNADNSFTLRLFLNCVYLLYYATC
jgi:hypothetical protein